MKTLNALRCLVYGSIANNALWLYYKAPRIGIQNELFGIHRWAIKKAYTARMANKTHTAYSYETAPDSEGDQCTHKTDPSESSKNS
jgi:hypothetical protein